MATVSVTGAQFTVTVGATAYTAQVTAGTITAANTVNNVRVLDTTKVYYNSDRDWTVGLEYLFDDEAAMYGAINTAGAAGTPIAVAIVGNDTKWTGTLYVVSNNVSYDATGLATVSASFTGTLVVADNP
jgi:hypothetical protein